MENIFHFVSTPPQGANSSIFSAEMLIAFIVAATTIITLIYAKYRERQDYIIKELREKKIPVYKELINWVIKLKKIRWNLDGGENKTEVDDFEFATKIIDFGGELIIWGSDDVLKNWILFIEFIRNNPPRDDLNIDNHLRQFDKLFRAIRKDLGHKNKDIKKGEIGDMFFGPF